MLKTALLALVASPLLVSATDAPTYVSFREVVYLHCGEYVGTGFRTGSHGIVTAFHVVGDRQCTVDGAPFTLTYSDEELDVAFGRTPVAGSGVEVDCGGFKDGEFYAGIGYARGLPMQRLLLAKASDEAAKQLPWGSFTAFITPTNFIGGMSGGPVVDKDGKVVGIVKGYYTLANVSYARALKDTPICKH